MTVLVLFDIDGTMLLANGAGRRSVHQAMVDVFGVTGPDHHPFDGKTDPQIVRELGALAGVDDEVIDSRMSSALERYYGYLEADITGAPERVQLLPGVTSLLDALDARDDVILGLLTGNIEAGATLKLRAVDIAPERFVVGAFGSDAASRPALPAIAQQRASTHLGRALDGTHIVIIGDTPHDLTCGRAIGARAIGVETGRYRAADLAPYEPLAVFADLVDTEAVVSAITSVLPVRAA
ncbi:MAG TPA: haloacid dehalogenase-like hydrolase [Gemmatimonadaceae bacterium]|nr:haloacid dehalogenase-like hydrolase [Gemmatimonadaceae bacterium]